MIDGGRWLTSPFAKASTCAKVSVDRSEDRREKRPENRWQGTDDG